jgi:hypothetical protein
MVILNKGVDISSVTYDRPSNIVSVNVQYRRSILNETITLKISEEESFAIEYSPFIPPLYYSNS